MSRRLFVFFVALVCVFGLLLLLSALLETPVGEAAAPAELPVAHSITAYVIMPPAPLSASVMPISAWIRIAALFAATIIHIPCLLCTCDANGRVLRKRRYVRSYHPVFKQELACG